MRRQLGVLIGIVAVLAGLQGASASAAWQTSGSGSAHAKAATLAVPTPSIGPESCSGIPVKTGTMSVTWPAAVNATSYDLVWWPNSSSPTTVSPATSPTSIAYNFGLRPVLGDHLRSGPVEAQQLDRRVHQPPDPTDDLVWAPVTWPGA